MTQSATIHFPRLPLTGAIVLVAAAVVVVAAARLGGVPTSPGASTAAPVHSISLRFEDQADGSVSVINAGTGELIASAKPGTNGFLRGALRGLMRVRKRDGGHRTEPFRLDQLSNGQLMLVDTNDGVAIDLNAYGQTNANVFRAFLSATEGGSS